MVKCNPRTISHQSQIRQKEISPTWSEFGSLRKDSLSPGRGVGKGNGTRVLDETRTSDNMKVGLKGQGGDQSSRPRTRMVVGPVVRTLDHNQVVNPLLGWVWSQCSEANPHEKQTSQLLLIIPWAAVSWEGLSTRVV